MPNCALTTWPSLTMTDYSDLKRIIDTRSYATVYERAAWEHDTGKHADSEYPCEYCPRCEMEHPLGRFTQLQAELFRVRVERDGQLAAIQERDEWTRAAARAWFERDVARQLLNEAIALLRQWCDDAGISPNNPNGCRLTDYEEQTLAFLDRIKEQEQ